MLNRRQFLQASSASALLPSAFPATPATASEETNWFQRPMRWAQLAFVEDDPGNYDRLMWLEYFRCCHVDAACLSAGGCVAFYPTKIPLHYRSKWLGDGDCFGEMVKGCRELGMNVIARTDPHAAHQDVYDAHPDWIAVDVNGQKRRHWADKDFWVTCALGPYNFDFMTQVTEEIVQLYRVDGIFTNRWSGSGMCYCEHCQQNFYHYSGLDLPRSNNPHDPARSQYILWRQERLFALWRLWDAKIKAINPHAAYIPNAGGGALSPLDMKTIGELTPTLFADRQGRRGVMPPWENGKNGKEYRATLGQKAIAGIFSVGLEEEYRWKDSVQNGDEIRLWMADGIAQGLRPWFAKFNAKPFDHRWMPVVEELYTWHHANERYLRNERSLARIGLVYSQQTATFYGGEQANVKVENAGLGFYQALIEARLPFEMVHDQLLDAEHLAQFRTLILPNIAALSSNQCNQLISFVEQGGRIIATFETSLYDEWGKRRPDFGLASLFGASYAGGLQGPMLNSYLKLQKDISTGGFHKILSGLEDTTRIINGVNRVLVKPLPGEATYPLAVVPSYPDLPMEEVFPRAADTLEPGVFLREIRKGRVVYFPWDIDRTFWEILNVDHLQLLRNAVLWANDEPSPVTIKGSGILDVAVWTQRKSMTVHLVNLTNPMMMKGPVRSIIPIPSQQVRIELPPGRQVMRASLLVANREIASRRDSDAIELTVPGVALHEVIALDFA